MKALWGQIIRGIKTKFSTLGLPLVRLEIRVNQNTESRLYFIVVKELKYNRVKGKARNFSKFICIN